MFNNIFKQKLKLENYSFGQVKSKKDRLLSVKLKFLFNFKTDWLSILEEELQTLGGKKHLNFHHKIVPPLNSKFKLPNFKLSSN